VSPAREPSPGSGLKARSRDEGLKPRPESPLPVKGECSPSGRRGRGMFRTGQGEGVPALPRSALTPAEQARALIRAAGSRALAEHEGKAILALYGIPTTREHLASTLAEARDAAAAIGYPVALKIDSPHIAHKTEAGAVLLNVGDEAALERGYGQVIEN